MSGPEPADALQARVKWCLCCFFLLVAGCADRQAEALALLAQRGYALSVADYHRAAASGDVEGVELLLTAGVEIDVPGLERQTALTVAVGAGHVAVCELLVAKGAKVPTAAAEMNALLVGAARSGSLAVLQRLLDLGLKPSPEGSESPCQVAAALGHREMVQVLLPLEPSRWDAAMLLARDSAILSELLAVGASIFAAAPGSGLTPMMTAAERDDLASLDLLLQAGADLHALDAGGKTVFDYSRSGAAKRLLAGSRGAVQDGAGMGGQTIELLTVTAVGHLSEWLVMDGYQLRSSGWRLSAVEANDTARFVGADRVARLQLGQALPGSQWRYVRRWTGLWPGGDTVVLQQSGGAQRLATLNEIVPELQPCARLRNERDGKLWTLALGESFTLQARGTSRWTLVDLRPGRVGLLCTESKATETLHLKHR
jgi:Ankyrin repeats (3 copies)